MRLRQKLIRYNDFYESLPVGVVYYKQRIDFSSQKHPMPIIRTHHCFKLGYLEVYSHVNLRYAIYRTNLALMQRMFYDQFNKLHYR